jgi:hypothetical protein
MPNATRPWPLQMTFKKRKKFATKLSRFFNFLLLFDMNYHFQEKKQHKIKFFELLLQISFFFAAKGFKCFYLKAFSITVNH